MSAFLVSVLAVIVALLFGYSRGSENSKTKITGELTIERNKAKEAETRVETLEKENTLLEKASEIASETSEKTDFTPLFEEVKKGDTVSANALLEAIKSTSRERAESRLNEEK